jgi:hypothetical protein
MGPSNESFPLIFEPASKYARASAGTGLERACIGGACDGCGADDGCGAGEGGAGLSGTTCAWAVVRIVAGCGLVVSGMRTFFSGSLLKSAIANAPRWR